MQDYLILCFFIQYKYEVMLLGGLCACPTRPPQVEKDQIKHINR